MLSAIKIKVKNFWHAGHNRSSGIKKNILYSFIIKGLSILVSFILVPITIHFVNTSQYGIWLTIYSLVAWINTFDVGLSNGLRNKLAHSIAIGKNKDATKYVSTTYALLALIGIVLILLFFTCSSFLNWAQLLHQPNDNASNIKFIIDLTFVLFCIQFILQPINSILTATHQPFRASLTLFTAQIITLFLTFGLSHYTKGSLLILVIIASGAPVISMLVYSIYYFKSALKAFAPKISAIDFGSSKGLLNSAAVFFFIQIGALVLYETDNIVISSALGPADVTTFNIAFKYFSIITTAFSIILTPYWSAFTDAYAKKDFEWINNSIKKLRKLWLYFSLAAVCLLFLSNIFYRIWVGKNIPVAFTLSLTMMVYVIVQNWMVIHSYLLNGTGKLKVQLVLVIAMGVINIPLSIYLIHKIGMQGTTLANIIVMAFMSIVITYQCRLVMKNKATGIWNS